MDGVTLKKKNLTPVCDITIKVGESLPSPGTGCVGSGFSVLLGSSDCSETQTVTPTCPPYSTGANVRITLKKRIGEANYVCGSAGRLFVLLIQLSLITATITEIARLLARELHAAALLDGRGRD